MKIMINFIFYKTSEDQPRTEFVTGMHMILEGSSFFISPTKWMKVKDKK